jgi:hypothetical protein
VADISAPTRGLRRDDAAVTTLRISGTVRQLAGFKVAQSKMEKWIYSTVPLGTKLAGVPEWLRK